MERTSAIRLSLLLPSSQSFAVATEIAKPGASCDDRLARPAFSVLAYMKASYASQVQTAANQSGLGPQTYRPSLFIYPLLPSKSLAPASPPRKLLTLLN